MSEEPSMRPWYFNHGDVSLGDVPLRTLYTFNEAMVF